MTLQALVVGGPGVGKSLLVARLGAYLAAGGRRARGVVLRDTAPLGDGVDPDPARRRQQARLLLDLAHAPLVLHLVDTPRLGEHGLAALAACDRELIAWAAPRAGYALLAARMDLPWAWTGLELLRAQPGGPAPLPVSARTGLGFGALRRFLNRCPGGYPFRLH